MKWLGVCCALNAELSPGHLLLQRKGGIPKAPGFFIQSFCRSRHEVLWSGLNSRVESEEEDPWKAEEEAPVL